MLSMKTSLLKFCEMSWDALTQFKTFIKSTPVKCDLEAFSDPTLQIAQATNEIGQMICCCPVEQAYVMSVFAFNPNATDIEITDASCSIEAAIIRQAELAGVSRLLMVLPKNAPSMQGERSVRILERRITPAVNTHAMGSFTPSQATLHSN